MIYKRRHIHWFRLLCWTILFTFGSNVIGEDAAHAWSLAEPQNAVMLPPGTLITASPAFSLPTLKAISINPNDPFKIDFVVDTADQSEEAGQEQVNLLVKYFLSFLTIPEEELWVNLSPYEKERIITPAFETTNAGRDMLVQDYVLKQLAASLTHPDHTLGKIFWTKVFKRAQKEYGRTDIPINSFNKVWVVPDKAVVFEENGSAFISESRLKVLVEDDYLSIVKQGRPAFAGKDKIDRISSDITREIIVPELEREVNEGKYFSPLRQMFNSLILAIWFKKRYKQHLISRVYVNQKKTSGIALSEQQIKEKIYAQYLKALKKGAYNFIREDHDANSGEDVPRKYFSGGFSFAMTSTHVVFRPASGLARMGEQFSALRKGLRGLYRFTVNLIPLPLGSKKEQLLAVNAAAAKADKAYNDLGDKINATPLHIDTSVLERQRDAIQENILTLRRQKAELQRNWFKRYGKVFLMVATIISTFSGGFLAHAGDLVILPYRGESVWWYEKDKFEQKFRGHHGGLTKQELEIPLLTWEM